MNRPFLKHFKGGEAEKGELPPQIFIRLPSAELTSRKPCVDKGPIRQLPGPDPLGKQFPIEKIRAIQEITELYGETAAQQGYLPVFAEPEAACPTIV